MITPFSQEAWKNLYITLPVLEEWLKLEKLKNKNNCNQIRQAIGQVKSAMTWIRKAEENHAKNTNND